MSRLGHLAATDVEAQDKCRLVEKAMDRYSPERFARKLSKNLGRDFLECLHDLEFRHYDLDLSALQGVGKRCRVKEEIHPTSPGGCKDLGFNGSGVVLEVSNKGVTCTLFKARKDFWRDCALLPGAPESESPRLFSDNFTDDWSDSGESILFARVTDVKVKTRVFRSRIRISMSSLEEQDADHCGWITKRYHAGDAVTALYNGDRFRLQDCFKDALGYTQYDYGQSGFEPVDMMCLQRDMFAIRDPRGCDAKKIERAKGYSLARVVSLNKVLPEDLESAKLKPRMLSYYEMRCIIYEFKGKTGMDTFGRSCLGTPSAQIKATSPTVSDQKMLGTIFVKLNGPQRRNRRH